MPSTFSLLAIGAAFVAALVGSLHCIGMCGPLRLVLGDSSSSRTFYQLGRLMAYLLLGALAGTLGWTLPTWAWAPILFLAVSLALLSSGRWKPFQRAFHSFRQRFLSKASAHPLLFGLASGLLPCGMLHAWVGVAATTANPLYGAILLATLWIGTLPALELAPLLAGTWIRRMQVKFPRAFPLFFLVLALLPALYRHQQSNKPVSCHSSEHTNHKTEEHRHVP